MPSTANLGMRVPAELKTTLEALAKATGRSVSFHALAALTEYAERESWQISEINAAIDEADAGDFATQSEVAAVFDRWANECSG